jgi:c-di-GMP-binding flagellar brake protein YcgR
MNTESKTNDGPALSAQMQQLASDLGTSRELRRYVRQQKAGQISLHVSYQRQPLHAQLRDISVGGIGFIYRQAMEHGLTFTIRFTTEGGSRSIKYKVVRCRRLERGRYDIGAEIIHVSREKQEK